MNRHLVTAILFTVSANSLAHADTNSVRHPSAALLAAVALTEVAVTDRIKIVPDAGAGKVPSEPYYCDSPNGLTLKALSEIGNVSEIKGAIEREDGSQAKHLFTMVNHAGLERDYSYLSTRINIRGYPGHFLVWVFFLSEGKAYANRMRVTCAFSE